MKWMMALTTVSVIGIGLACNSIYSEFKFLQSNQNVQEISSSMYESIIWHIDIYNNPTFYSKTNHYFDDELINTVEYQQLQILASKQSTPMVYINVSNKDLLQTKLHFRKVLKIKADTKLFAQQK